MSSLSLRGVTKRFGATVALDEVSLEIAAGELLALLGPSGCGKTTLLRVVAGLERPDAGRVLIGERDVTEVPTRRRPIGMVFQHYALFPNLTIRENVAFPLSVRGRAAPEIAARVNELLGIVRLEREADRYPNQISGGQAQRAALARALAPQPDVLLLDEPLSALDAVVRIHLRDEIRRIQQLVRTTAIYVTHDQAEALAIADRVAVVNHGRIEEVADPAALYDRPATSFVASFVGARNAIELPVRDGRLRFGAAFDIAAPIRSGRATVFFRPDDVQLLPNGGGQPARVEVAIFGGPISRLHLVSAAEDEQARLFADVPSRQAKAFPPGAEVSFAVDPDHLRCFVDGD